MDPERLGGTFLVIVLVLAAIAAIVVSTWAEHIRRKALKAVADRLGLTFAPAPDFQLARQLAAIPGLREGENRYARNVLSGLFNGHSILTLDFHFQRTTSGANGKPSTSHYHRHVTLLDLERTFPHLTLGPEVIGSKIAQSLGYEDIDFESDEFSRRFCVRSASRKFAYDFCNARMIAFLLDHPNVPLAIHDRHLAFVRDDRQNPAVLENELAFAVQVRELMPAYLFAPDSWTP